MSKLKLLGNSGGDGVITLTAPNTNADRTITLPDSTDSLAGQTQVNRLGGRKNLLFNGGFDVSQRGDFTNATTAVYGDFYVDRCEASFAYVTASILHNIDGHSAGTNSLKITATSTATGNMGIRQRLEFANKFAGKTLTLSAKVKSNTSNARLYAYAGGRLGNVTHSGNGSWETLSTTFTMPTGHSILDIWNMFYDNGNVSITSGDYIEVAEWQLEVGSVATDFEHRSYGEELALCQRYYYRIDGSGYTWIAEVQRHNSTGFRSVISLPVAIRDTPTITYSNLAYWYNNGSLSAGTSSISTGYTSSSATDITQLNIEYVPTSMTLASNYNYSAMLSFTSAGGYLAFDAEL